MIEHLLIVNTSLGPAQIILERFMGTSWQEEYKRTQGNEISDIVDAAISPLYQNETTSFDQNNTTNPTNENKSLGRQENWRKLVLKLTMPTWKQTIQNGEPHVVAVNERYVVSVGIHDLIFMITGTDEDDELGLHKILTVLIAVIRGTMGKVESEKVVKSFGKMVLIIDQIFDTDQGTLISLEIDHIMNQTKMKKAVVHVTKR